MRWFWVDQFTEFVSGSHACGIKNVSLDEEVVDEYVRGYPMLPPTLIIEGIAQLGGIMVALYFDFEKRVVLAKVGRAIFHSPAVQGDQLRYRVEMKSTGDAGAIVTSTSHLGDQLQAEIELMFAFLEPGHLIDGPLFEKDDLRTMLRLMRFFHVAVDANGNPLPHYDNL